MASRRCRECVSEPLWGARGLQKADRSECATECGEHVHKGWGGLVAIPGANRPDGAGRAERVLREPEHDQIVDEEGERGCPLDGARRLALRVGQPQELFSIMKRDLQAPATRIGFQDEPRLGCGIGLPTLIDSSPPTRFGRHFPPTLREDDA